MQVKTRWQTAYYTPPKPVVVKPKPQKRMKTERVVDYLKKHGPTRNTELAKIMCSNTKALTQLVKRCASVLSDRQGTRTNYICIYRVQS